MIITMRPRTITRIKGPTVIPRLMISLRCAMMLVISIIWSQRFIRRICGLRVCEKGECDSLGSVSDFEDGFSDGEEECT